MAFPAFLEPSVLDATLARTSDMASLASASPAPSLASSRSSFTCKNGSACPPTSCSAEYPARIKDIKIFTSTGTCFRKCVTCAWSRTHSSSARVTAQSKTPWCLSESNSEVPGTNSSARSGTFFTMRTLHSAAFLRT